MTKWKLRHNKNFDVIKFRRSDELLRRTALHPGSSSTRAHSNLTTEASSLFPSQSLKDQQQLSFSFNFFLCVLLFLYLSLSFFSFSRFHICFSLSLPFRFFPSPMGTHPRPSQSISTLLGDWCAWKISKEIEVEHKEKNRRKTIVIRNWYLVDFHYLLDRLRFCFKINPSNIGFGALCFSSARYVFCSTKWQSKNHLFLFR